MIFIFRLKTGPNHQYSDLEAEKLVYKPLKLVLDDRVSFKKGWGGIDFFGDFRLKKKSTFFLLTSGSAGPARPVRLGRSGSAYY